MPEKLMLERMKVDGKMASVVGLDKFGPDAKVLPLDKAPKAIISWDDGSVAYVQKDGIPKKAPEVKKKS